MGRELQKKKNRSSLNAVRRKPKSKKKILSNPIIAANWDQKETLSQNYRRLGLTSRLNHVSGGTEKNGSSISTSTTHAPESRAAPDNRFNIRSKLPTTLTPSEARIERDPETGAIIRVLDDPDAEPMHNPLDDPLNELEDSEPEEWTGFDNIPIDSSASQTDVIKQLEEAAAMGVRKAPRKQSKREEEWIEKLVQRYGDDYKAMVRDTRLNPMQQSEGDLKRRAKKWRGTHPGGP